MKNIKNWPSGLPLNLELPKTSLSYNLEVSAHRYPDRHAIIYYGNPITYAELKQQVDSLAGFLQKKFQVVKGDHIALYMQNSPQFVIAYYAILRTGAIVVPVNAMNLEQEIAHIISDSDCKAIIYGQELGENLTRLPITHRIAVTYSDYIDSDTDLPLPDVLTVPPNSTPAAYSWREVLKEYTEPIPVQVSPDDLAVLPYTSGTTGRPKGCLHTHNSVMHTAVANTQWNKSPKDQVALAALPMFHVSGMQAGINTPIYAGGTTVIMTRWDKRCAAMLIERYRVSAWSAISTMLCDFLNQADLDQYDLSSLHQLTGGGAAMPKAVAEKIYALWGIHYVEGYGLTETMAPTHINPPHRPKAQCLGIPICSTESIVIDPEKMEELPTGSIGEIVISGPQVFLGYHNNAEANAEAFVCVNGQRYFRTGDLGYVDDEGYFFMVDRLKRMINASGYKVWPAEVETMLYAHPAILEACVIAYKEPQRGEGVKALVVLKPDCMLDKDSLVKWAREQMAAYKVPDVVEFLDHLPKNAAGKLQWRALQEKEFAAYS
jgi:fatty-acyl-CoA synthase